MPYAFNPFSGNLDYYQASAAETDPVFTAWLGTSPLASYVPTTRTLTINGTSYDLSANRSWTIAADQTFGTTTQVPYMNAGGTDFLYSDNFKFTGSQLLIGNPVTPDAYKGYFSLDSIDYQGLYIGNTSATKYTGQESFTAMALGATVDSQLAIGRNVITLMANVSDSSDYVGEYQESGVGRTCVSLAMYATGDIQGIEGSSFSDASQGVNLLQTRSGTITQTGGGDIYIDVFGGYMSATESMKMNTTDNVATVNIIGLRADATHSGLYTAGTINRTIYGGRFLATGNAASSTQETVYGLYVTTSGTATAGRGWGIYYAGTFPSFFNAPVWIDTDAGGLVLGEGQDAEIKYNGTNLIIDPRKVGSGNVGINTALPDAMLHVVSTTEQLRLGYDATNYTSFTINGTGNLTIAPSGGLTTLGSGLGIGVNASAAYALNIEKTYTATSGAYFGMRFAPTMSPSADGTADLYGFGLYPTAGAVAYDFNSMQGLFIQPTISHTAGASITNLFSIYSYPNFTATSAGTITNLYNLYLRQPNVAAGSTEAVTNLYQLYIAAPTIGATSNYSIYSAGGRNYFGGAIGIGVSSLTASRLETSDTITANSGTPRSVGFTAIISPSSAPVASTSYYGQYLTVTTGNSNFNTNCNLLGLGMEAQTAGTNSGDVLALLGANFAATHRGTGTLTNLYCAYFYGRTTTSGNITNAYGWYVPTMTNGTSGVIANAYGGYIANQGAASRTASYGLYIAAQSGSTTNWSMYNGGGNIRGGADNDKIIFGTGLDASIYYDGTNLIINPKEVGSGILDVLGVLQTDGYKSSDGTAGATGTITLASITTITVKDGLITAYS